MSWRGHLRRFDEIEPIIPGDHNELTELEARDIYLQAWLFHRLGNPSSSERQLLEWKMDWVQPYIALGPFDPRWKEFAASLPGFLEFWANARNMLLEELLERSRLRIVEDDEEDT
jgi:hypothetical protein